MLPTVFGHIGHQGGCNLKISINKVVAKVISFPKKVRHFTVTQTLAELMSAE